MFFNVFPLQLVVVQLKELLSRNICIKYIGESGLSFEPEEVVLWPPREIGKKETCFCSD